MKFFKILLTISVIICIKSPSFCDGDFLWLKISGKWDIDNASRSLVDTTSARASFGYNDLYDTNSIISMKSAETFTSLSCDFLLHTPCDNNQFTVAFSISNSNRNFIGVRFLGTKDNITRIALIQSSAKNDDLPSNTKNNFSVETLTDSEINLSYDSPVLLKIDLRKSKIKVSVNGKSSMEYFFKTKLPSGRFGFSHLNNLVQIKSFNALNGKTIVFTDDFLTNRIKTVKIIVRKETQ